MPIVWTMPDGSKRDTMIMAEYLESIRQPGETTAQTVARYAESIRDQVAPGATFELMTTADFRKSLGK